MIFRYWASLWQSVRSLWTMLHSAAGQLTWHPDSTVAEQETSVNGLVTSVRSRSNLTTTFGYDGLHRRISVTDPRTGTATVTYHTAAGKIGLVASESDAAGNTTSYEYDANSGRLLWKKNALNKYARYAYNARGQQTRIWAIPSIRLSMATTHTVKGSP